jgi:hypothetical protein
MIFLISSLVWAVSRSDIKKFRDLHALMSATQTFLVATSKLEPQGSPKLVYYGWI